jgi:hypothetical protein
MVTQCDDIVGINVFYDDVKRHYFLSTNDNDFVGLRFAHLEDTKKAAFGLRKKMDMQYAEFFTDVETGSNDGGKNSFYEIPEWVKDLDDLAEYLQLDGFEFNTLKTLWINIGMRHTGTTEEREIKKRIHYSNKSLKKMERKNEKSK